MQTGSRVQVSWIGLGCPSENLTTEGTEITELEDILLQRHEAKKAGGVAPAHLRTARGVIHHI
jgi:hypothetical protein